MPSPASVSLLGSATVFVVKDVLRSVQHYCEVLGFHKEFTYGEPTFYAGVERDGVLIHLQAASETKRQPRPWCRKCFRHGCRCALQGVAIERRQNTERTERLVVWHA